VNSSAAGFDAGGAGTRGALVEPLGAGEEDVVLAATAVTGDDVLDDDDGVVRSNPNSFSATVAFVLRGWSWRS
jgi:hypothetical protein